MRCGRPRSSIARARSTVMPSSRARARKSRIVQRWMLGVSYHFSGREWVTGMRPRARSDRRTRQLPKLGKDTTARRPIRTSWDSTWWGSWVACRVWLRITKSKAPGG